MKQIISILATVLILLAACSSNKLSEEERATIRMKVDKHNVESRLNLDVLKTNLHVLATIGIPTNSDVYPTSTKQMEDLYKEKLSRYKSIPEFDPFRSRYDTNVTVEKHLRWCETAKRDPMESLSVLEVPKD